MTGSDLSLIWAVRMGPRVSIFLAVTRVHVPQDTTEYTAETEVTRVAVDHLRSSVVMANVWTLPVGRSPTRVYVTRAGQTMVTLPRVVRILMNVLCPILHVPRIHW